MTENFVTLFDSFFLPQGLALYESLKKNIPNFVLWVICMDPKTQLTLDSLMLTNIKTIDLNNVETPILQSLKKLRTRAEYCWTLSPFSIKWIFEIDDKIDRITYVDADMYFFKSPTRIFNEFENSNKSVLITEHAYDADYDQTAESGHYCVQFMIFKRNISEPVRKWWEDKCVEWCYSRLEDGKFGDQKYLDDWSERFSEYVHVLSQIDVFQGPYNAKRFPYSKAIAFHFSGFKILSKYKCMLHSTYRVPIPTDKNLYITYMQSIKRQLDLLGYDIIQYTLFQQFKQWFIFYRSAIYQTIKNKELQNFKRRVKIMNFNKI